MIEEVLLFHCFLIDFLWFFLSFSSEHDTGWLFCNPKWLKFRLEKLGINLNFDVKKHLFKYNINYTQYTNMIRKAINICL